MLTICQVFKNLLRRIPPGPESEFWAQSVDHDEPVSLPRIQALLSTIRRLFGPSCLTKSLTPGIPTQLYPELL